MLWGEDAEVKVLENQNTDVNVGQAKYFGFVFTIV